VVLTKYKYEGEPDMHKVPPQEELLADNVMLTRYEYMGEPDERNGTNMHDVQNSIVQDVPKVP
jgi:hypothetical protein